MVQKAADIKACGICWYFCFSVWVLLSDRHDLRRLDRCARLQSILVDVRAKLPINQVVPGRGADITIAVAIKVALQRASAVGSGFKAAAHEGRGPPVVAVYMIENDSVWLVSSGVGSAKRYCSIVFGIRSRGEEVTVRIEPESVDGRPEDVVGRVETYLPIVYRERFAAGWLL